MTLPPIREWWAELSPEARLATIDATAGHLPASVREEVREITGAVVGIREALSEEDLDYARTHPAPEPPQGRTIDA